MAIMLSYFESGAKFDGSYDKKLVLLQDRLHELQLLHSANACRTLIVIEGWDVAGYGEAIQPLTANWDPRYFSVFPITAPSIEEQDKHFLWRFWTKLPGPKEIHIFAHSYYGRVLSARVDGKCTEAEWRRGYDEINEFEAQQGDIGTKIIKLFLHITADTYDNLLKERLENLNTNWMVGAADFHNRDRREDYLSAIHDMFEQTNTRWAPWKVIDANNQKAAHVAMLQHVIAELEASVPQEFPDADSEITELAENAFGI